MSNDRETRRVSDAYREAATERSPASLDERIIAMAAHEARTPYGLARTWVRPLAWAATIALSFAFVLEMTYFDREPPAGELVAEPAAREPAANESAADEFAAQRDAAKRTRAPVAAAPDFKVEGTTELREAEDRAAPAAAARFDERASLAVPASPNHCDAAARESAESWYACVLMLREQGLHEVAAAELAALHEAFPDFEVPVSE